MEEEVDAVCMEQEMRDETYKDNKNHAILDGWGIGDIAG